MLQYEEQFEDFHGISGVRQVQLQSEEDAPQLWDLLVIVGSQFNSHDILRKSEHKYHRAFCGESEAGINGCREIAPNHIGHGNKQLQLGSCPA